jgi:hypothetical protein
MQRSKMKEIYPESKIDSSKIMNQKVIKYDIFFLQKMPIFSFKIQSRSVPSFKGGVA